MRFRFRRAAIFIPLWCCAALAQQAAAPMPIARMPVSGAKVSGNISIAGQEIRLASGSTVEAGQSDAGLALARGGTLKICMGSMVHLAAGAGTGEMMFSLDRGAMELHGAIGAFSDVVVTPDLRILLSGPGEADVKLRTNQQGDTCIDNAAPANSGTDSPYVTVTEQLGTGVYRVQPGQRVMLEHGSVASVVDNEKEPCGCPPAPTAPTAATDFPMAQSEGLAPPPPVTQPAVPVGEVHAQATIPFVYDSAKPPDVGNGAASAPARPVPAAETAPAVAATPAKADGPPDLIRAIGHLFRRIFRRTKTQ